MAPFDKSTRSVVKHKTRKPFAGGGGGGGGGGGDRGEGSSSGGSRGKPRSGGGFKVGPRHAPDGAYLGKAKRIKANLIANAKTMQRFYKSIKGKDNEGGGGGVSAMEDAPASLGRFAPEAAAAEESEGRRRGRGRDDGEEGEDLRRRTSRAGPPPPEPDDGDEAEGSRRWRKDRAGPPPLPAAIPKGSKRGREQRDAPAAAAASTAAPSRPAPRYASREEALAARQERQEKWNKASGSETGRRRGQPDLGSRMEVLLDKIRAT